MKFSILHTALYLAKIINYFFTTGFVPNILKIAKVHVCPVYKNCDKTDVNNNYYYYYIKSYTKYIKRKKEERNLTMTTTQVDPDLPDSGSRQTSRQTTNWQQTQDPGTLQ